MEYEGTQVFLTNPQDKIKHLMRVANGKDNEIRELTSQFEETKGLLEAAEARITKIIGDHVREGQKKKKSRLKTRKGFKPNLRPET